MIEEKDAIGWAVFTMINEYPKYVARGKDFAPHAIARLEGLRAYIKRQPYRYLENGLNAAITEIKEMV